MGGFDASRFAGGGGDQARLSAAQSASTTPPIQFYRAVVEEIIFDTNTFDWEGPEDATEEDKNRFMDIIASPEERFECPDNTLLVRIITQGDYKSEKKLRICHPLFPSHLQMPIKAGEQVFMLIEGKIGYWIARAPGTVSTDDANYSHYDRKYVEVMSADSVIDEVEALDDTSIGRFNNGALAEDKMTFKVEDDYTVLWEKSQSNFANVYEPIPKFINRPGDLVLQGSHNTLICMGTNRGWPKDKPDDWEGDFIGDSAEVLSNSWFANDDWAENEDLGGRGSIDLVVGRGRYKPAAETTADGAGDDPIRTACRTMANERDFLEADRAPAVRTLAHNLVEGDPDFGFDSARILLTMKSDSDIDFGTLGNDFDKLPSVTAWLDGKGASNDGDVGTGQQDDDESYTPDDGESGGRGDGTTPLDVYDSSYTVIKSDEIRLVARFQEKEEWDLPGAPAINGSIKIIKEGVEDAEDGTGRAVIMLMPDGTIMIDGPTVIIGSGGADLEKDNGLGTQIVLGRGATEPIVLGQILKNILDTHLNDFKTHIADLQDHVANVFDTHTHPTGVGPSGPPLVPGAATDSALSSTDSALDDTIGELVTILSKYGKTK